jgi:tripartite motif-containing protein 71
MAIDEIFTQAPADEEPNPPRSRRRRVVLLAVVVTLIGVLAALTTWYLRTGKPLSQLPGLEKSTQPPHYLFSIYGVKQPLAVAVNRDGDRIYISETGGPRLVHVFDRSGTAKGTLKPPTSSGGSHVPSYVAVDPKTDEVYVSDRMTAAIYVYGPDNAYRRTFTPKGDLGGGWAPLGLAFDQTGRLYVTDVRSTGGHRVLVFGPDGALQRTLAPPSGSLSFPNGLVVDSRGDVDVADSNNARVITFSPDGKVVGRIAGGGADQDLGLPRGLAVDDSNRLYVVDTSNHLVRMYKVPQGSATDPQYVTSFGTEGTTDGAFEYPNGVAADSRARLYVTDRENDRLQVWSY